MIIPVIDNKGIAYKDFTFFTKGGMGEIYKGVESETDKSIILKLIIIENNEYEELLKREIDVSMSFTNRNIVNTKAIGKIEIDGNLYYYIIQEYYKNGNLRKYITKNTQIDKCLIEILQILNGMKEIHTKIVHRDLKPENILIDDDNNLRITDFGLAKYIDEKTRTKSFKGFGTLPYMAPECWTNDENSVAMDIYSLGIMFFEMLAGELPFQGKSEIDWRDLHMFTPIPNLMTLRGDCSIKINQIIQKMTIKRVSERYKSIIEVISAFNEAQTLQHNTSQTSEKLALIGNLSLQKSIAEELKKQKEIEENNKYMKMIDFHINELFLRVKSIVENTNAQLEGAKIQFIMNQNKLQVSFLNKRITFSFSDYKAVKDNEENLKNMSLNNQRQRYGNVLFTVEESFFKKNSIILVGLLETNYKVLNGLGKQMEIGFNLALVKHETDLYGKWYKIKYLQNHQEPSCGIGINQLLKEYSKFSYDSFSTTEYSSLEDSDLVYMLEKIM